MNPRSSIKLALDENAWIILDSASTQARGEIPDIVRYMQAVVSDGQIEGLCERIGVCSAGFLFHDVLKGHTRFYRENELPPTYSTTYLWDDQEAHDEWSKCLQWLFVLVREHQYQARKNGDTRAEDYFANLPVETDIGAFLPERGFRERFGVHYCTAGEMLYTAFAWRYLCRARDAGLALRPLQEVRMQLSDRDGSSAECIWRGRSLSQKTEKGVSEETRSNMDLLSSLWGSSLGGTDTWHSEWRALLLSGPDGLCEHENRISITKFLSESEIISNTHNYSIDDDEAFNGLLQNSVPEFLCSFDEGGDTLSVSEALVVLESRARFPILPFYFWNALNGFPICYGVMPIWTSQNHSIKVPTGECYHLGLALTGLRPIAAWDWSVADTQNIRVSRVNPVVLISFLRLMARPLVEGNLYYVLFKEVREALKGDIEGNLGLG